MDRRNVRKVWRFLWYDDSIWSWIVNIILAFIIIKFLIYPSLGAILHTSFPVVAVVSGSMEHRGYNFDEWWSMNSEWYIDNGISKEGFSGFPYRDGFNKGDVMILYGKDIKEISTGDILIYRAMRESPIIHRVVKVWSDDKGGYHFQTKGDNNPASIESAFLNEKDITQDKALGIAIFRIPYLGWIKISAVNLLDNILGVFR